MRRGLLIAGLLLAGCSGGLDASLDDGGASPDSAASVDSCSATCTVEMDDSWIESPKGVYTHSEVGQVGTLKAGQVCAATMNGILLSGSWIVEDPGSWTRDMPSGDAYIVQSRASIGAVSSPIDCLK